MRHHYIPQFLLEPWTSGADRRLEVFRLDLDGLPSSRRRPRYTAFERDLYALSHDVVAGMSKHDVERKLLAYVDGMAAISRTKLLSQGPRVLSHDDRIHWARFLMSLRLRQPSMVAHLKLEAAEELKRQLAANPELYEAHAESGDPETMEEWVERKYPGLIENVGLSFFQGLVDEASVGIKIMRLRWWVCRFDSSCHKLILADEPCVFTHGIDSQELIIALPLAPDAAFLATRGDGVEESLRRTSPATLAVRLNESAIGQACTRAYSTDIGPRRFIENRWAKRVADHRPAA